jgi:hypothetical protein
MQAASLLADDLFASQAGLCSMALGMSNWQAM